MAEASRKSIVVAGGTGGIGRHVVDGILAAKKFSLKVFTRQDPSSVPELTAKGVEVVKVDYSDHRSLVQHLQGVHTVIVTLIALDDSCITSQVNLLNASLEAKVKRFAPSEWAGQHENDTLVSLYRHLKFPVREKVKASGIEFTIFINGLFMDYFVSPQRASQSLPPHTLAVDFNKCEAAIVGTGDEPFSITLADDVGKFVAAALDLDRWDEKMGMVGSQTTWNELVKLGEEVRGKKFNVKRTTVEETLKQRDPKPAHVMANFMSEVYAAFVKGEFVYEPVLNKRCPQVKPTTIREFITQWWGDKKGQTL